MAMICDSKIQSDAPSGLLMPIDVRLSIFPKTGTQRNLELRALIPYRRGGIFHLDCHVSSRSRVGVAVTDLLAEGLSPSHLLSFISLRYEASRDWAQEYVAEVL
jgi:hypothetical protein